MAFFPCIYFEALQMTYYTTECNNLKNKSDKEKFDIVINRIEQREKFYILLYKLIAIVKIRSLRMIIENPATQPHYLLFSENFIKPTFIDNNRQRRGDYFRKPTAYWFINIDRTFGESYVKPIEIRRVQRCKSASEGGVCSEERSLISPLYARNFICDFILGRKNEFTQTSLFDN